VDSEPGQGARFWLELPLPRGRSAAADLHSDVALAECRVLVVDDNPTNREILQRQLHGWRMKVHCAASGAEGLQRMQEQAAISEPFALAVLDMHMPQMDGLQLANAIQADPVLAGTRLVVLTSSYSSATVRERERAGILRCVHKPIRRGELHEVLCSAMRSAPQALADSDSGSSASAHLHGAVLLAEDNPTNQHVAQAMLAKLGLEAEIVDDGEAAVRAAAARRFDLILMDCHMPRMDGYEASTEIRRRLGGQHGRVPIIALTADVMEGNRERCLQAGMDDFLSKPYRLDQLRAVLQRWLGGAARSAEKAAPDPGGGEAAAPDSVALAAIDRSYLDQFRELDPTGGMALVGRILRVYAESSREGIARLQATARGDDGEALRQAAHALKSSSANVGATTLAAQLKALELCGRENRMQDAHRAIDEAVAEYQRVMVEIDALLREIG